MQERRRLPKELCNTSQQYPVGKIAVSKKLRTWYWRPTRYWKVLVAQRLYGIIIRVDMYVLSLVLGLSSISFLNRENIWRSCSIHGGSLWVHKSRITSWKKIVWWARLRMNAISISSISSPKVLRTNNEVRNSYKLLQQVLTLFQRPSDFKVQTHTHILA